MYIEVLIGVVLVLVFLFATFLLLVTKWWHNRRYKPENDKSRLGEEKRRRDKAAADEALRVRSASSSVQRSTESTERAILPSTSPSVSGSNSIVGGKAGNGNGITRKGINPFRRRG